MDEIIIEEKKHKLNILNFVAENEQKELDFDDMMDLNSSMI